MEYVQFKYIHLNAIVSSTIKNANVFFVRYFKKLFHWMMN